MSIQTRVGHKATRKMCSGLVVNVALTNLLSVVHSRPTRPPPKKTQKQNLSVEKAASFCSQPKCSHVFLLLNSRYLISQGACVGVVNSEGETPLDIAEEEAMEELLQNEINRQGTALRTSQTVTFSPHRTAGPSAPFPHHVGMFCSDCSH